MFKITSNAGFHIVFKNGLTLSTQFGRGNYCNNHQDGSRDRLESCPDAEIAIWDSSNKWITKEICDIVGIGCFGDDVISGVTPEVWADIVTACKNWKRA